MGRAAVLAAVVAVAASGCGASESARDDRRDVATDGVALAVPDGWQARTFTEAPSPPTLELGNFPLPPPGYPHGTGKPWPRGAVFLRVADWTEAEDQPWFRDQFAPAQLPIRLTADDLRRTVEGVPDDHGFAQRLIAVEGRLLEVTAEFGERPATPAALAEANDVLAGVRVEPS